LRPFLTGALASAMLIWVGSKVAAGKKKRSRPENEDRELMDAVDLENRMIRKAEGAIRKRTSRVTVVIERCSNDFNYSAILRTVEALGIQNVWIIGPPPTVRGGEASIDEDLYHEPEDQEPNKESQAEGNANDSTDTANAASKGSTKLETMKGQIIQMTPEETESRRAHHLFASKALEYLTLREFNSTKECIEELRNTDHIIWATDLSQQATPLTFEDLPIVNKRGGVLPEKLAIVFGTEAVGCTTEILEEADRRVYLPLRGFADSLNLSVATALVLHQLFLLDPSLEGSMSPEERHELRCEWFPKLALSRIMTTGQKKQRARLTSKVAALYELERRLSNGEELQMQQFQKLVSLRPAERELLQLEATEMVKARKAVQPFIDNPPSPITDMRRPDEHRTWFGGKNTKMNNPEWHDMPATTAYDTQKGFSTKEYFRSRLEADGSTDDKPADDKPVDDKPAPEEKA